ncbi:MAG: hypothetical protein U0R68_11230 [Candidatus Nanopelagicales bacterium]
MTSSRRTASAHVVDALVGVVVVDGVGDEEHRAVVVEHRESVARSTASSRTPISSGLASGSCSQRRTAS